MDDTHKQAVLRKIQDLKALRIFASLDERDIFKILRRGSFLEFPAHHVVFSEQEQDHSLYVVVRGQFEISALAPETQEKITFFLAGEGLIFGEMAFLDRLPRSATVVTLQPSEVLKIDREAYDDLLVHQPIVAAKFMFGVAEILSRRLRAADQRIKYGT
jgi:CRP-like cAMP-binding protein